MSQNIRIEVANQSDTHCLFHGLRSSLCWYAVCEKQQYLFRIVEMSTKFKRQWMEEGRVLHQPMLLQPGARRAAIVYPPACQVYLEQNREACASQRCPASTFEDIMTTTARSNSPFLSTFPGRYYYEPAIFQEEQEHIFGKMWFYVGRADALPTPGSYRVVTVANESIIVVR